MKDRFQTILNLEKISAAQLSAILGIQRSTLSNILGGRNNPSYEVIHGLLTKLPNLNIDWLLTGEGQPYRNMLKNFRGDVISKEKNEEQNSSEILGDITGENSSGNKSDLFGFEKPDEDFPSDIEQISDPGQVVSQLTGQAGHQSANQNSKPVGNQTLNEHIQYQSSVNKVNNLSGVQNTGAISLHEVQKREKEQAEMQAKMKRLQQIVNEKTAAAKRSAQPSENQINGTISSTPGQIKELIKVILLYTDGSFEEYEKI
ncbi:MAG: helix-turn-helix transcriptional regulator [Bacteroidales bacterium]|nr:helix-turn-helix transcriptional regulator [Bacteroidales bacterium]MDD4420717.1 helix-turn-helix transcriptional regulator [Bacteroidales bacterium]